MHIIGFRWFNDPSLLLPIYDIFGIYIIQLLLLLCSYYVYTYNIKKKWDNEFNFFYRTKVLECSAKDDHNVIDLFKNLLSLSRILPAGTNESTTGLKRRSSAYVSATSKGRFFLVSDINILCAICEDIFYLECRVGLGWKKKF